MTLAKLPKKYGVHLFPATHAQHVQEATQIGTWKRAAIKNMSTAFSRKGALSEQVSAVDIDKLHSKIGQVVVEQDLLADASQQLLGTPLS